MELSYERDSHWRPHLSWTFSSCSLQKQMEEQAAQRELAWQKLTARLGNILIADGGGYRTFMESDYKPKRGLFSFDEEEQDHLEQEQHYQNQQHDDLHQQSQQDPYQYQHQYHKKQEKYCNLSIPASSFKQQQQNQYNEQSNNNNKNGYTSIIGVDDDNDVRDYYEHYKKAKRRCLTVSTILISLTMLLFTIVILMAIGIVHR